MINWEVYRNDHWESIELKDVKANDTFRKNEGMSYRALRDADYWDERLECQWSEVYVALI